MSVRLFKDFFEVCAISQILRCFQIDLEAMFVGIHSDNRPSFLPCCCIGDDVKVKDLC